MVGTTSKRKKHLYNPLGTYINKWVKKDMTYILGARCKDGVVLVSDTKLTIDDGASFAYSKKLAVQLNVVVMGASGLGGLYKDFQNRVISKVAELESRERERVERGEIKEYKSPITTPEQFFVLISKIIRDMHNDYEQDRHLILQNLMILCGTRINAGIAELSAITPYGFPEPISSIKAIGHGEPYGAIFLKKWWNKSLTMEQVAKLGLFIIKFIQDTKIDNSVGYEQDFLPQVYYIPDVMFPPNADKLSQEDIYKIWDKYKIRELEENEVNLFLNEISGKISEFENYFRKEQLKL